MSNRITDKFTLARVNGKPLLLDGATGTLLVQQGLVPDADLWFSFASAAIVEDIHRLYASAGADIITTNTFRTNPAAWQNRADNEQRAKLLRQFVTCAKGIAEEKNILVAGCNAAAEDCYSRKRTLTVAQLKENHHTHIQELLDAGADFILNETLGHRDEANIVSEYCTQQAIPYVISLFCTQNGALLSGEPVKQIVDEMYSYSPLAVSINCILPETAKGILPVLQKHGNYGFYLNCGAEAPETCSEIICSCYPWDYSAFVKKYIGTGVVPPVFVGACCGSSPAHTQVLYDLINNS